MNQKAIIIALSLLALSALCCGKPQPTPIATVTQAPAVTAMPTLAPTPPAPSPKPTSPPASAQPTSGASANEAPPPLSVEHLASPTDALTATIIIHTEAGVDVFVTGQKGTFQVGAAIPSADYRFNVELEPDTSNQFIVAVRRTYEPFAGAQKNYDLLGKPLVIVQGAPPPTPSPVPLWTAAPQPSSPAPPPATSPPPVSDDLVALVDYLLALQPSLEQALTIAQRDGEIVQASEETKDDSLLCDGRLSSDAADMVAVVAAIQALSPPAEAAKIHRLLLESGTAWAEALDQIDQFCQTGQQIYKLPALLKFGEAVIKFQDAYNRFWALIVAQGLEDWVQRP